MIAGYTIKHRDEFETMEGSGSSTWRLARKALGTSAFGFNLVEIGPGGATPEHDESGSGQVELYVILEGEAVMRLGGERSSGAGRHLRLDRTAGQPDDPQPLREPGDRAADRRRPERRIRAGLVRLTAEPFTPAYGGKRCIRWIGGPAGSIIRRLVNPSRARSEKAWKPGGQFV